MKKRLILILSFVLCMFLMAGCGKEETKTTLDKQIKGDISTKTTSNFEEWLNIDFSSVYNGNDIKDENIKKQFKGWEELIKKLGKLTCQSEPSIKITENADGDEEVTATIEGEFENGKINFSCRYDLTGNVKKDSIVVDEVLTMGQVMENALINTLMGMGTVFSVLILISLVITLLGYIGQQAQKKATKSQTVETVSQPVVMTPMEEEPKNLEDDKELVAVITAAIMASMGEEAPAEGLVVRSIRKRNVSKWKNA